MLISESRFRKIINEELKKLMKEAAPAAGATQSVPEERAKKAQSAKTYLDGIFNNFASFLRKKNKGGNATVLLDRWNEVKNNKYQTIDQRTIYGWADRADADSSTPGVLCILTGIISAKAPNQFEQEHPGLKIGNPNDYWKALGVETEQDAREVGGFLNNKYFIDSLNYVILEQSGPANKQAAKAPATSGPPAAKGSMAPGNTTQTPGPSQPVAASKAPATSQSTAVQSIPYTVRKGDTITKVLQAYYAFDPRLWSTLQPVEIQSIVRMFGTNNPNVLIPKQQVNLLPSIILGQKQYKIRQPATTQNPTNVNRQ